MVVELFELEGAKTVDASEVADEREEIVVDGSG